MRIAVLQQALAQTWQQQSLHPKWSILESIAAQLAYLVALESGTTQDASRLQEVTLGVHAIGKLDDQSPGYAEFIHAAAAASRKTQAKHRVGS